jgi:hypothetical protein
MLVCVTNEQSINISFRYNKRRNNMRSSKKAVTLGVIVFLLVMLVYGSFSRPRVVFAYSCENFGDRTVKCCQTDPDGKGAWCTTCNKTDPPSNCSPRFREGRLNPTSPPTNELPPSPPPPPKNVLPPSSQQQTTCPDGSVPDAKDNCPTTTTNQQLSPSQNLAGPASNNNNPQLEHHHHKGKIGVGESTAKKANDGSSQQQSPP